jgi:hypothetical protein
MINLDDIARDADELRKQVSAVIGVDLTPELAVKLYEAAMGPENLEVYRVITYFAHESDKCRQSGAWFSACLMTASAIEGLLTALCLFSQTEVETTGTYKSISQAGTYKERILRINLDKLVQLAAKFDWIPSDAVAPDLLQAAIIDFPLFRRNLYPHEDDSTRAIKFEAFKKDPGIEMLQVLQHMRNLVHPNRWPRFGITITSPEFESDCKFIYVIAYQVMGCLFETFSRKSHSSTSQIEFLASGMSGHQRAVLSQFALDILSPGKNG